MTRRMFCTDCRETGTAHTVVEGSDGVEMVGWLCLALPGWLYCLWRHALRIKICAACGSAAIMREATAVAARQPAAAVGRAAPALRSDGGAARWPGELATPRVRLRRGGPGALLGAALLASQTLTTFGALAPGEADPLAALLTALWCAWLLHAAAGFARRKITASACRAWDATGRELRIELL